jgi:sugar/nucleoside kinase (ribokinase family)
VLDRLQADGVDCRYVRQFPGRATAVAFVAYFANGSRKFIYHIDGTPAVMNTFDGIQAQPGAADYFHVMGCSLMASDAFRVQIFRAVEAFSAAGARISFDPNIRPELLGERRLEDVVGPVLERCAVLLPGTAELALLSGAAESDPDQGAARLFQRYPLEVIVRKHGRKGCAVYTREGLHMAVGAYRTTEMDPTGAGDCFDAAFLCAYSDGKPLAECVNEAAAAGALAAAAFGPMEGNITPHMVREVIDSYPRGEAPVI